MIRASVRTESPITAQKDFPSWRTRVRFSSPAFEDTGWSKAPSGRIIQGAEDPIGASETLKSVNMQPGLVISVEEASITSKMEGVGPRNRLERTWCPTTLGGPSVVKEDERHTRSL